MNINRVDLVNKLKQCMPGIETGNSLLEGADTFYFEGKRIHTFNDIISVSVDISGIVSGDLTGSVSAKEFYKILTKFRESDITIDPEDKQWILRSGKAKSTLKFRESVISNMVAELKLDKLTWKNLPDNFLDGLKLCRIPGNHTAFNGVAVDRNGMYSTDKIRVNKFNLSNDMERFWIEEKAHGEILKFDEMKEYSLSDFWIHFRSTAGDCFSVRRKRDTEKGICRYPFTQIDTIVFRASENRQEIGTDLPQELEEVLSRASVFSSDFDGHSVVHLVLSGKFIECSSSKTSGSYSEKIKWKADFKEEYQMDLAAGFLFESLKLSPKFSVANIGDSQSLVFFGDNFIHVMALIKSE